MRTIRFLALFLAVLCSDPFTLSVVAQRSPRNQPPKDPKANVKADNKLLIQKHRKLVKLSPNDAIAHLLLAQAPLPRAVPLSRTHFEGVFPPSWKQGDTWRTMVFWEASTPGLARPPGELPAIRHRVFTYHVLRAENGGEHELEIRPRERSQRLFTATFSSTDGTLILLRWSDTLPEPFEGMVANGPVPFFEEERNVDDHWPIVAFPAFPEHLQNPLFYMSSERGKSYQAAQVVFPTDDGLRFLLKWGTVHGADQMEVRWRRGEPWWSTAWHSQAEGYLIPDEEYAAAENPGFDWHAWRCAKGSPSVRCTTGRQ